MKSNVFIMRGALSCAVSVMLVSGVLSAEVRVSGDRVLLRAAPIVDAEVVGKTSKGDRLHATGRRQAGWVQVAPPSGIDVYVYKGLIREGRTIGSDVLIRVGPGIGFRSVGKLAKGRPVHVRGITNQWLRISPPENTYLWISGMYVAPIEPMSHATTTSAIPAAPVPVLNAPPVVSSPQVPAVPVAPTPVAVPALPMRPTVPHPSAKPRVPAAQQALPKVRRKVMLVESRKQGKRVVYRGTLRTSAMVLRKSSDYRVVSYDPRGYPLTTCFVAGDTELLMGLVGRQVSVSGREYWVQGVRQPLVVADGIMAVKE